MPVVYVHICAKENGAVLLSNTPNDIANSVATLPLATTESGTCPILKTKRRHRKMQYGDVDVYVALYGEDITNRIFQRYFDLIEALSPDLSRLRSRIVQEYVKKFRRLRHNIVSHNANILQEVDRVLPPDALVRGWKSQLEDGEKRVRGNTRLASDSLLRIKKFANLMKSEFDVYDLLYANGMNIRRDIIPFEVHKVVVLSLQPFWLDLSQKNIAISIGSCEAKVQADYTSISVILCHLFDNTVKYIMEGSAMSIEFRLENNKVIIDLEMSSLKIEDHESDRIWKEEIRGTWADRIQAPGSGIGLSTVRRLIAYCGGSVELETNVNPSGTYCVGDIPFERNRFTIYLPM